GHGMGTCRRRHGAWCGTGACAGAGAVERPEAVPTVARQLAEERCAGEPAPAVRTPEVQRRRGRQQGACSRARGVARRRASIPGAPLRLWHGLILPL
ncbi:hypothetical protein CFC21_047071, partial [Triticum aestivum]